MWYSGSYTLLSKRVPKGVCGCHRSACAGLRSIFPAGLFYHQPKLQMEGRLHTSQAQFCFLDQICQVSCSFKIEGHGSKTKYLWKYLSFTLNITPTKKKKMRKGMPLVGYSRRRNPSLAYISLFTSLSLWAISCLPHAPTSVWSLLLRDKQKQSWKSSRE